MSTGSFNLNTVIETAKTVITNPVGFYRGMAKSGGFAEPIIFLLVMAVASGLVMAVLSLLGLGPSAGLAIGFAAIIIYPIMALIGSFILAAILFVVWKLMGSPENYETAYRCVAYAAAISPITAVLGLIPYLGILVSVVWGTYLMITASTEVHGRAQQTALIVFGILGGIALLWNLGAEHSARSMRAHFSELEKFDMNKFENMKPEEAGKAVGEFLKGLEKGVQSQ